MLVIIFLLHEACFSQEVANFTSARFCLSFLPTELLPNPSDRHTRACVCRETIQCFLFFKLSIYIFEY